VKSGDGFVMMHGMVKKLSNPDLIRFLEKLAELIMTVHLDKAKPVSLLGLMLGMKKKECRDGLGVYWSSPGFWGS
jgi:uncharacterized protein YjgD (DUF1641 family)